MVVTASAKRGPVGDFGHVYVEGFYRRAYHETDVTLIKTAAYYFTYTLLGHINTLCSLEYKKYIRTYKTYKNVQELIKCIEKLEKVTIVMHCNLRPPSRQSLSALIPRSIRHQLTKFHSIRTTAAADV